MHSSCRLIKCDEYLYQSVVFMTSAAAEGPRAAAQTNPRHLLEVCPTPGEGGAVQENQGHRGEVRRCGRRRRGPPEEAVREEG